MLGLILLNIILYFDISPPKRSSAICKTIGSGKEFKNGAALC